MGRKPEMEHKYREEPIIHLFYQHSALIACRKFIRTQEFASSNVTEKYLEKEARRSIKVIFEFLVGDELQTEVEENRELLKGAKLLKFIYRYIKGMTESCPVFNYLSFHYLYLYHCYYSRFSPLN